MRRVIQDLQKQAKQILVKNIELKLVALLLTLFLWLLAHVKF